LYANLTEILEIYPVFLYFDVVGGVLPIARLNIEPEK
jgi:hypothetical protein